MANHLRSEKGAALLVEVILLALVLAVAGLAIYNANQEKKAVSKSTTPIPHVAKESPTPTPTPELTTTTSCSATNSASVQSGWKTAYSGMAKFTFQYPSSWACRSGVNNGGAETIYVTSPGNFQIEFISFTPESEYGSDSLKADPDGACTGCLTTNSSEPFNSSGYGTLLLTAATSGAGGGTQNELLVETARHSVNIVSPKAKAVDTGVWAVFQGLTQDQYTQQTYSQFSLSSDVQTAEQVLKTLSYQ